MISKLYSGFIELCNIFILNKQKLKKQSLQLPTRSFLDCLWVVLGRFWVVFLGRFWVVFGSFFAYISYQGQKVKFRIKTLAFLTQLNPHHFFSRYNTEGFINSGFQTRAENDAKHPEFA